jgi:hypothetical protein
VTGRALLWSTCAASSHPSTSLWPAAEERTKLTAFSNSDGMFIFPKLFSKIFRDCFSVSLYLFKEVLFDLRAFIKLTYFSRLNLYMLLVIRSLEIGCWWLFAFIFLIKLFSFS